MKKLSIILLSLFLVFVAAACGGVSVAEPFDADPPWGAADYAYEMCEYSVTVKAGSGDDKVTVATGSLVQELKADGGAKFNNKVTVDSKFRIAWNNRAEAEENKNLSDAIDSTVLFRRSGMLPVTSYKKATIAKRPDKNNLSYEYWANYFTSTEWHPGIEAKQSKIKPAGGEEQIMNIPDGNIYDNEQLFYLLRAFKNMQPGVGIPITINNVHENYMRGKAGPLSLSVSAGGLTGEIEVKEDYILNYRDNNKVNAFPVSVKLSPEPSGPAHMFLLSEPAAKFGKGDAVKTSKLILEYEYYLFDITGALKYTYTYKLVDYVSY